MSGRIIATGVLGALGAAGAWLHQKAFEREARGGPAARVVCARDSLALGARVAEAQVSLRDVPEAWRHPEAILEDEAPEYLGRPLQNALRAGQPLLKTDFVQRSVAADRPLSQLLPKGMRALAIPVSATAAVGGLLRPGDHVDVLGTFARGGQGDRTTVTLLQNVAVLATGARTEGTDGADAARGRGGRFDTVTLAVSLEEAELLAFAKDRGELGTVLRHEDDVATVEDVPEKSMADIFEPARRVRLQAKHRDIEVLRAARR